MRQFAGITKVQVTDGVQTATINVIGTDGTSLTNEIIMPDSTQSNVYGGERYSFSVTFFDDTDITILQDFEALYTPVKLFIFGPDSITNWQPKVTIEVVKNKFPDKRSGLNTYTMTTEIVGQDLDIKTAKLGGIGAMQIGTTFTVR